MYVFLTSNPCHIKALSLAVSKHTYVYVCVHRYGHMLSPFLLLSFGDIIVTLNENPLEDVPGETKMFQSNQKANANDILSKVELSSRNNDLPPYLYLGKTDLYCSPLRDAISLF